MSAVDARSAVAKMWTFRTSLLGFLTFVFALSMLPWVENNAFTVAIALCFAIVGLSMNVLAGYAGQISLTHAALFGVGAFAMGNLVTKAGVPWLVALPIAGLITAAITLLIGFPALRIRGLHLAIATLGFQFVMNRVVFRQDFVSGGASGLDIERPHLFGASLESLSTLLLVFLTVLVLIWMIDRNLTRSRAGRAFFALRQDEQVAASVGIPVARYKLLAFGISGFYAGIAGALYGTLVGEVTQELFDYPVSIEILVFAVLGGLGSRYGTAIGGAFPVLLRNVLQALRFSGVLLGGVLLVFTLIRYQGGMAGQGRELAHSAKLLRLRGPIFFAMFFAVLAITIASSIAVPWLVWFALKPVYELTSLPLILIGLTAAVVASLILEKVVTKAATSAPSPSRDGLIYGMGALGAFVGCTLAAGFVRLILFFTQVVEDPFDAGPSALIGVVIAVPVFAALAWDFRHEGRRLAKISAAVPAEGHLEAAAVEAAAHRISLRRTKVDDAYRGPLLEVRDLAMHFGGVRALDGVSMEIRQGELIGIMGPNGSGKTTMLNCISGFLTPTAGDVRFRGRSITKLAPHARAALGIGRTFQNIGLVKNETVFDNFIIAQHLVCGYGPLEGLLRTGTVLSEERRLRQRAATAMSMLGLDDVTDELVRALPHGRAKLVELGCALVTGPEVLLLDEPAAGVGPQEADALGETLKRIAADFGVTIVMIEHHVPLMLNTCDYIYVLNFGQLLTHGEPADVARHPDVIAAYLGTSGTEASVAAAARL